MNIIAATSERTVLVEIPNRYTNTCQWAGDIEDDDNGDGMNSQGIALWKIRTSRTLTEEAGKGAPHA